MQSSPVTTSNILPTTQDFTGKINMAIQKSQATQRPFFILIFQIENLEMFKKRRSETVVLNLIREMGMAVRKVVHPSQFVGRFEYGLGLVFDAVEVGQVDTIARKLSLLLQNVIKEGHYNDLSGRWSDILHGFLHPNNPGMIFPKVGWSVFPRDGQTAAEMIRRAHCHINELAR